MSSLTDLTTKLREIFQINRPDLDFGIYRILNSRSAEISDYLANHLPSQIQRALNGNEKAETAVYNHLISFFSRYYDSGDFISQRRYKGDTYAVPYSGEEVLLHWANKDQYYTKSGENFSHYRFTLEDGKQVHFRLVAADTEKDNRKETDEKKRVFRLAEPAFAEQNGVLEIYFDYSNGETQAKENAHTLETLKSAVEIQQNWAALLAPAPTDKNKDRTLLEKQLTDYSTKNTADYFIHKDLGGFLRRELDFYIKNDVMNLDNIQHADDFALVQSQFEQIKILREVASDIIAFLAQLEDFQKALWLKKKFVAGCHYLISLVHIPAELVADVFANRKQLAQWQELFDFCTAPPQQTLPNLSRAIRI